MPDGNVACGILAPTERAEVVALTRAVLTETGAQKKTVYDERFFTWQYESGYSSHLNVVARAGQGGSIVGSYPSQLLPMQSFGRTVLASICQDLCTARPYRRSGLFAQMGEFAERTLCEHGVAVSYAFPNHRSLPGFVEKHHHRLVAEVPLLLKPVPFAVLTAPFVAAHRFRAETLEPATVGAIDEVWTAFRAVAPLQLVRDARFIRWRFLERPHADYEVLLLRRRDNERPVAYAVLRPYRLFKLPVCLLMDFGVVSADDHLGTLLREVERRALAMGAALIVTLLLGERGLRYAFARRLYLPIPSRLQRRKFSLVARANLASVDPEALADRHNWHVTFADWDVF